MWTQIAGKIALALTPPANHYWNAALQLGPRGLRTQTLVQGSRSFMLEFDFVRHEFLVHCSDGSTRFVLLHPMSVAEFYRRARGEIKAIGIDVKIWPMPVEIPDPIRFTEDTIHASYDRTQVEAFWSAILSMKPVMEAFRCEFVGKCSPVHFFWGSFDVAVSRFSGRRAPARPEMGAMYAEAYSHEVISHGFWPGSGPIQEPAFYSYTVPAPEGYAEAKVSPAAAYFHQELGEFILPYEAVRTSASPEQALDEFLRSTYEAGANLAGWNREELERKS
jgi:hypothetical protein